MAGNEHPQLHTVYKNKLTVKRKGYFTKHLASTDVHSQCYGKWNIFRNCIILTQSLNLLT